MTKPRHTLLVLDDEPDVVKSVRDLLRLDYNVLTATNAQEGLTLMQSNEVHVVMTDQRMPGMTGVEFLKSVRGDFPEAIRLLFTGYADLRAVIDAINQGNVYRYITKPWDPEELQAIVKEACERHDLITERNGLVVDLQAKNTELEQANFQLSEANNLKTAFIQVASHELRTPLTILMGLSDLAARAPGITEPIAGWIKRIRSAGERLFNLVNQIVTMLAAGEFAIEPHKEPTDLNALLSMAVEDLMPFFELRNQRVLRQWNADIGSIAVEASHIRSSLNHLLLNAIKFTPDGGTITVKANRNNGSGVDIEVSDNGSGIPPENLKHLFKPFFTGVSVEHHSSGLFEYGKQGLGLGLSVVKAFVEKHGGSLGVQTELNRGTTFTIHLPA